MKNLATKLAAFVIGEHYPYLETSGVQSRKKVQLLAFLIVIPVILWAFAGGLTGSHFLGIESSWLLAICAFIPALIIFILDRSIISAGKVSVSLSIIRPVLAILVAVMNAIIIDTAFYENDLAPYAKEIQREANTEELQMLLTSDSTEYKKLEKDLAAQKLLVLEQEEAWRKEMQGNGSGRTGNGPIARELKKRLDKESDRLTEIREKLSEVSAGIDSTYTAFNNELSLKTPGILTHLKALYRLVSQEGTALVWWLLVTSILCIIELMPFFFKKGLSSTAYEVRVELEEQRRIANMSLKERRAKARDERLRQYSDAEWLARELLIDK